MHGTGQWTENERLQSACPDSTCESFLLHPGFRDHFGGVGREIVRARSGGCLKRNSTHQRWQGRCTQQGGSQCYWWSCCGLQWWDKANLSWPGRRAWESNIGLHTSPAQWTTFVSSWSNLCLSHRRSHPGSDPQVSLGIKQAGGWCRLIWASDNALQVNTFCGN